MTMAFLIQMPFNIFCISLFSRRNNPWRMTENNQCPSAAGRKEKRLSLAVARPGNFRMLQATNARNSNQHSSPLPGGDVLDLSSDGAR
jgi:hypothetical protein